MNFDIALEDGRSLCGDVVNKKLILMIADCGSAVIELYRDEVDELIENLQALRNQL